MTRPLLPSSSRSHANRRTHGSNVNDQAATLRVIRGSSDTSPVVGRQRALAITGGKGGVGKSTIAVNLAVAYATAGARTLLVDTDLGMADLNLLLGVAPNKSLLDALHGAPLEEVVVPLVVRGRIDVGPRACHEEHQPQRVSHGGSVPHRSISWRRSLACRRAWRSRPRRGPGCASGRRRRRRARP